MINPMIYIYIDPVRKYMGMFWMNKIGTGLVVEVGNRKKIT